MRDAAAGLLGRGRDPVLQVRGPDRHGLVEARRDAVHPLGEGASALRQPFGDPLGGADEVVAHGAGTGRQGLAGAAGRQRQGSLGIAPAALDRLGDRQAGALDLGAQREAAAGDVLGEGRAGLGEAGGDVGAHRAEALGQLRAPGQEDGFQPRHGPLEALAHGAGLALQRVADAAAGLLQGPGEGAGILGQAIGQGGAGGLEGAGRRAGAVLEAAGQGLADLLDGAAHLLAGGREGVDEVAAAGGHEVDHPVAGLAQGGGDRGAAGLQGAGHPLARAGHGRHDPVRGAFQVLAQALVGAGNGAAHPVGVGDDRLALGHQLVHEGADADLVVGIGPLQGGDLAPDQGLQLAGPGERPLDAVAHRRHLAAHGLRHGQDRVGGEALGLGQTHRDLAHRTGDEAHLLGAHRQHGGDHEQHHRAEQRRGADARLQGREPRHDGAQVALGLRPCDQHQGADPDGAGGEREQVGLGRGAHPQGLLQDADVAPVVVGHQRAVGGQEPALAARAVQARRRQVGGERRVEIEARRHGPPGGIEAAVEERLGVTYIGQAWLGAAIGAVRRQGVEVQRLLDRRERGLGRVLQLLLGRHSTPRYTGSPTPWGRLMPETQRPVYHYKTKLRQRLPIPEPSTGPRKR